MKRGGGWGAGEDGGEGERWCWEAELKGPSHPARVNRVLRAVLAQQHAHPAHHPARRLPESSTEEKDERQKWSKGSKWSKGGRKPNGGCFRRVESMKKL